MSDIEFNEESKIILEKIKGRPINKKRLFYYTLITAVMAVVFGLVAGFTFSSLSPILSGVTDNKETYGEITFPEDPQEMLPEEMITETPPARDEWVYDSAQWENFPLNEEQLRQVMSSFTLGMKDYRALFMSVTEYAKELKHSMVTITCTFSNKDWLENIQESQTVTPGVFIAQQGEEYYILTEYSSIRNAEKIRVALAYEEKYEMAGTVKAYDPITDIAIVSIEVSDIPKVVRQREGITIVSLTSSNVRGLEGTPVIALGSPMGTAGSMGYGMITSTTGEYTAQDSNYKLVQTDIAGSTKGKGFLFTMDGELIGMITERGSYDMKNLVCAYGITDLKPRMEKLTNGKSFASVGITGGNVPRTAHEDMGIPYGAYVQSVMSESPAMVAGMQQGDVITIMDGKKISSFNDFSTTLLKKEPGASIEMMIMRRVQNEYREMTVEVNLGKLE